MQRPYKGAPWCAPPSVLSGPADTSTGKICPFVTLQILQRSGGGAVSVWHCQTPDLWECGALAERAERPRWQQHRHHAGWQQKRPAPPQGRAHRRSPGLCRCLFSFCVHSLIDYWYKVWTKSITEHVSVWVRKLRENTHTWCISLVGVRAKKNLTYLW